MMCQIVYSANVVNLSENVLRMCHAVYVNKQYRTKNITPVEKMTPKRGFRYLKFSVIVQFLVVLLINVM